MSHTQVFQRYVHFKRDEISACSVRLSYCQNYEKVEKITFLSYVTTGGEGVTSITHKPIKRQVSEKFPTRADQRSKTEFKCEDGWDDC